MTRYEYDHWDDAIHGYRERERLEWNDTNMRILDRVKALAFDQNKLDTNNHSQNISATRSHIIKHIHVLDLHQDGYIKSHVDAVRFCGNTIAGSVFTFF